MRTKILDTWKLQANQLKIETCAIYLAYKDPRVPWYARILIVCVIGYSFSPIDKFLNSIPIIGYLDHLILVPLGVALAFKRMIPSPKTQKVFLAGDFNGCMLVIPEILGTHGHITLGQGLTSINF